MNPLAQWTIALTSAAMAFASAAFVTAYSNIERNDAAWQHVELPTVTEWFARLAPFGLGVAAALFLAGMIATSRRQPTALIVVACLAMLFAFPWVLACLFVWRTPYVLIGTRIGG